MKFTSQMSSKRGSGLKTVKTDKKEEKWEEQKHLKRDKSKQGIGEETRSDRIGTEWGTGHQTGHRARNWLLSWAALGPSLDGQEQWQWQSSSHMGLLSPGFFPQGLYLF